MSYCLQIGDQIWKYNTAEEAWDNPHLNTRKYGSGSPQTVEEFKKRLDGGEKLKFYAMYAFFEAEQQKYIVMNRFNARQATYEAEAPETAIISVTDYGSEPNKFYPQPWLRGILELQFNDVLKDEPRAMTKKQAQDIAAFVRSMQPLVERFIIHCEFGQSRSAGIAAAISDFFEGHDSGISNNRAFHPNWHCYKLVTAALKTASDKSNKE